MIYADNAATSPLSPTAFEKMKPLMLEEFGNASQLYSFSRNPRALLQEAREIIAGCIHAAPEEIFLLLVGRKVITGLSKVFWKKMTTGRR